MSATSFINTQISRTLALPARNKVRILFVSAVIIGSALIGLNARPLTMTYILIGFVAMGAALLFLRRPLVGIAAILTTGMFVSYSGPGGVNITVALVMVLPVLWVVEMVVLGREFELVRSRVMWPIYLLIFVSTLAFAMGQFPYFEYADSAPVDAQLGGYAIYVLSFIAFFITATQVRTLDRLKKLTWAFLTFACLYLLVIAVPAIRALVSDWFGTSGSLFWLWFLALSYGMALFNDELSLRKRGFLLLIVGVSMYILFALKFDNKSGWVPAFFVLWVITFFRSWKVGVITLLGGGIAALYLYGEIYGTEGYSLSTRLELLPIMWQIFSQNPIFGVGFGNYHFFSELFAIRGWYVTLNSHNNYVDIFVQTGILGALAFAWFVVEMGVLLMKLRNVESGFARAYINAALGGFAGMLLVGMLGDWFLPFVYNIGLIGFRASVVGWVFLGGVLVIEKHYSALKNS